MNKPLIAVLLALPVFATIPDAKADPISDRVYLTPVPVSACGANQKGFTRIIQQPDGSYTTTPMSAEFVVPQGMYLEITSVEYTTPYSTIWAQDYTQTFNVSIKQRVGSLSTPVVNATYMNKVMLAGDDYAGYAATGELASSGGQTHVSSFPTGPIMSSAGRLCAGGSVSQFWSYGGYVTVRGRLIPTNTPVSTTTGTNSL